MDTRLLRSFLAVARLQSFTDAALDLGYTQSTVTSHIQKLEHQLGTSLLDRLPTGVQVTEAGARLIPRAEDVLDAENQLQAVTKEGEGEIAGTVRIMAPESLCTYRLPDLVTALRDTEPGIDIWLTPGGINHTIEEVRRGNVDLGLTLEPQLPASELRTELLGYEELVLLAPPGSAPETTVTWDRLAREDALLIEEGCGYSDNIAANLRHRGEAAGRRSHFGSIEAIKRCVAVGLGWAALPAITAAEQFTDGTLQVLNGPELPDCEVHALIHPRRYRTPATDAVLNHLRHTWNPDTETSH
ncbi:LysR family transcriptional regulator [Nesterenkonia alba]|uniref:LysR family transcriptional regulator n=1 Tax=Nesterenkonia alba TaxID=515814 RepID=UPI0003B3AE1A|nr:LysR family transcriptional regulator [Nesterenkonia alba]